MDNITMDIDALNTEDFEGAVSDVDEYPEPPQPRPVFEGTYTVKLKTIGTDKDSNGKVDPKNPKFVMHFEVVDTKDTKNTGEIGKQISYIRIKSRPYLRGTLPVSDLGDLIRAFDKRYRWQNNPQLAARFLQSQAETGATARIKFVWEAWDKTAWELGGGNSLADQDKKDLGKKCRVKYMKNFAKDGTVVGPSGETLTARCIYGQAYPSKDAA